VPRHDRPEAPSRAPSAVTTGRRRTAARLAAVQALYQIELTDAPAENVIREFAQNGLDVDINDEHFGEVDEPLFADLVRGAMARREELDHLLAEALTPDWPVERLERVLRAILRVGAYELLACEDVPMPVVISEYLDIGHAFFAGKEPGLVNGVLDRLARTLRPDELAGEHRDAGPPPR
jgi:transcription antitermination protein NusB